ncbi:MAG: site-specific DNA-methyltransferase [Candidatus Moranbacteria bacterium]|nr:site-specific DNA-methyltransferase [Candidatus Moranbacteria bacterium]
MVEIESEKYKDLSREDLLKVIEKMDSRKKYGLIWDEDKVKEQFEKDAVNALPILKEIRGKEIATSPDEPINILIEGDNYHALSVLNFTHQGKIDVIYIDPPYNTGNKDFKYNDSYIDKEDAYRHSKWLSFMNKRLRLAKSLLNETGVIYISIDDNEIAQLKLLCDEIFGENNFVNNIALRVSPPNGVKMTHADKTILKEKEYVLVYAKNNNLVSFVPQFKKADKWDKHFNNFIVKNGKDLSKWEVVSLSSKLKELELNPDLEDVDFLKWARENSDCIFQSVGLAKIKNIKKYNTDRIVSIDNMDNYFAYKGRQVQLLSNSIKKTDSGETLSRLLCDLWVDISFNNLFQEGGVEFKFGKKPQSLIKRLIKLSTGKKDAMVLDFFAGSGSTLHAILELNGEDGGARECIICTNDEEGICTEICYPRIKNAIKGYGNKKGNGGNLKYFKTGFVKKTINRDDMKMKLTRECTEMLCIREGVFDEKKKTDDYLIFEQGGRIMAVYYSIERKGLKELKKELDKMKGEKVLYCFTLDPLGLDKSDFTNWKDMQLEPIPQKILEVYEEIYEY